MRSKMYAGVLLLLMIGVVSLAWGEEDTDRSKRAWLGVSIQDMTPKLAKSMGIKTEEGALVSEVIEDSPAEKAGIEEKDIIIEFNGRKISDADDLMKAVRRTEVGTKVDITVVRKDEQRKIAVTLGKLPRSQARLFEFAPPRPRVHIFRSGSVLGVEVMELNDQLAEYFQVPPGEGVLIQRVEKKSAAEKAGLKAGDVILRIGTKSVDEVSDIRRALERYEPGEKVEVEVMRKGAKKTFSVEIEEDEHFSEHEDMFDIDPDWKSFRFELKTHPPMKIEKMIPEGIEIPKIPGIRYRVVTNL
ncbi:MAG TPA: PDZ domain-containing protein [Bacteroidota bacterium]|nr:PDZ domain-containing protein [Bacteroidota bacterium]